MDDMLLDAFAKNFLPQKGVDAVQGTALDADGFAKHGASSSQFLHTIPPKAAVLILDSSAPTAMSAPLPSAPPPEYTADGPDAGTEPSAAAVSGEHLQVLIAPAQNSADFQTGLLGVEGEHAAVEGEVQIKGAVEGAWHKVSITLQSVESSGSQSVELSSTTQVLYSRSLPSESSSTSSAPALPSSLPFSIPLTSDIPECLHTPTSSLFHYLKVELSPSAPSAEPFQRRIPVHIRRYSTFSSPFLPNVPHTVTFDSPAPVTIQLPRLEFRVGEPIPVYVSVPPPDRRMVAESGIRLRNVKAELVRLISLNPTSPGTDAAGAGAGSENPLGEGTSSARAPHFPDHKKPTSSLFDSRLGSLSVSQDGTTHSVVLSRSGAACRFHSSRPIRLRLVLHPFSLSSEVTASGRTSLASTQSERQAEGCASITQTTLLHNVSFQLLIRVGFFSAADRSDLTVEQNIPITMIAGLAPEEEDITAAQYSKKHDPPPDRTIRYDEDGPAAPPFSTFDTGVAGLTTPDVSAPPPFFSDVGGSLPPSFLEAASEVGPSNSARLAEWSQSDPLQQSVLRVPGEGEQFGFRYEDIYDGFGDGSRTPPPPMAASEQAADDDSQLAALVSQANRAMEAMDIANMAQPARGEAPPPPPAMDDPSDPPPAIDDAFRPVPSRPEEEENIAAALTAALRLVDSGQSPSVIRSPSPAPQPRAALVSAHAPAGAAEGGPPPYPNPPSGAHHADAPGPPPYTDFPANPTS